MKTEKEIIEELKKHDDAYYNGNAFISDSNYDSLREEAQIRFPNNEYFKTVGSPVNFGEKIIHETPMLSLNKAKTIEEVQKWLEKILNTRENLIVEPKIDGISGVIKYVNEKIEYIATRGGGTAGKDITHVKDYIKTIPKRIEHTGTIFVKGEFYIPKNNGKFIDKLRNNCSGIINRKTDLEDLKYINFVTYNIEGEKYITEEEKIKNLSYYKFHVINYVTVNSIKELKNYYEKYLDNIRDKWNYQTDGLVISVNNISKHKEINLKYVVDHHPHQAIAFKPPSQSKKTYVTGINYQMSRHGNLIPVLEFNPIEIDGVNIERCTLNNFEWVKRENFHYSDVIEIERANDVIPRYVKKIKNGEDNIKVEIPIICPSCKTTLIEKGVHLHCSNKNCDEQQIQQIIYYCKKAEMEGFAESTLRLLYKDNIISSIIKLYDLNNKMMIDFMSELDGLGDKKIKNIIEQVEKSKTCTISEFIDRLGIEQVGKKAVKKMKINTLDDFWKFNNTEYVIGQKFIEYRDNNINLLKQLIKVLNIIEEKNILNNKGEKMEKVVMTGKGPDTRKNLVKQIENKGYEFQDSITKETNILLCEDPQSSSSKLQKARKLNILVMSYDEFFKD